MDIRQWHLTTNKQGHLISEGCDLVMLAKEYTTPLHSVSVSRLRKNYHRFRKAFQNLHPQSFVYYSYKTNCIPGVIRILHDEGCGAEVISPYEFWLSEQLRVDGSDVIYNGVNKSVGDLTRAVEREVRLINVESPMEIERLITVAKRLGKPVNAGIRIYPAAGWKAQFGLDPEVDNLFASIAALRAVDNINVCGLHVHIGSGLKQPAYYRKTLRQICDLMAEIRRKFNITISNLDIGGGYGVPTVKTLSISEVAIYKLFQSSPRPPELKDCASIEDFAEAIVTTLQRECKKHDFPLPNLILEPGRILTSDAQILLLTIQEIKVRRKGLKYALADGGMQNIAFPLSYEYHHCFLANHPLSEPTDKYNIMGTLCSPEDFLYRGWPMPGLQPGDVLAIMDAGAYFNSFANNFAYPRPGVVLLENGIAKAVRKHEEFQQMIAADIL